MIYFIFPRHLVWVFDIFSYFSFISMNRNVLILVFTLGQSAGSLASDKIHCWCFVACFHTGLFAIEPKFVINKFNIHWAGIHLKWTLPELVWNRTEITSSAWFRYRCDSLLMFGVKMSVWTLSKLKVNRTTSVNTALHSKRLLTLWGCSFQSHTRGVRVQMDPKAGIHI